MFAQINTKTEFSFLSSVVKLDEYVKMAKKLGYKTLGICDYENLHAAFRFVRMAKNADIQPIIAIELPFTLQGAPISFSFIAKNTKGYKNILRISTMFNYQRRDFEQIKYLLQDVAVVIPATYSDLQAVQDLTEDCELYVAVDEKSVNSSKLPELPFPAVRYLNVRDYETLNLLQSIRLGEVYQEKAGNADQLLKSAEEQERYFAAHHPQALSNLTKLLENISYDLAEHLELPKFDPKNDAAELLRTQAINGLTEKKILGTAYQERLEMELSVIHKMGFDDYFLIVADLLRYAKEQNIYCGMGRGSAAGSLVAFVLGITQVDPVKNHLIFERFLNAERIAMPDIDIDMPDDRRGELLQYMKLRYGREHVAQIVTFSTLGKRQALRDAGKAFGMSEGELSNLTRMLSRQFDNLTAEYDNNLRFKSEVLKDMKLQQIVTFAKRIEGMPRQTSTHASGVVLSELPLVNYTPLKEAEELPLTQYEAPDVEALGLLKIDFLGLRNLTIVSKLQELVKKRHQIDINPLQIDLEDEKTLSLFRAGNTLGIFQFENPQMRRFLRNLAPVKFDDIVDATSIFRPGPSQFIPQFVARRHGKEKVELVDDSLTEILAPTYGIMIYQEQIMQVAQRFAGFSLGKADLLRRAISKKKGDEFEKLHDEFITGSLQNGHNEEKAEQIYGLIERFANYGFNRSHAYAYAALAFQIAYFKAHFPDEFYQVQLRENKREIIMQDALDNDYQLVKLDVNKMPTTNQVKNGKIYLGLYQIKGLQRDLVNFIYENRPFVDLTDFIKKMPANLQRDDLIRPMIQVGCFDCFDQNRGKLLSNLTKLLEYCRNDQLNLFEKYDMKFYYQEADDLSLTEKYNFEKELLTVGITPHPLQNLAQKFDGNFVKLSNLTKNKRQTILVELLYVRKHRAKNGQNMAFLTVSDGRNQLSITLFAEVYRKYMSLLEQGKFFFMTGKISERNDELQMLADTLTEAIDTDEKLWLNLANAQYRPKIRQILAEFPGSYQVISHQEEPKETIQTNIFVEKSDLLLKRLEGYVKNAIYK